MSAEIAIEKGLIESVGGKKSFVLKCSILSGSVDIGSSISIPFSTGLDMTVLIDEIEIVRDQCVKIKVHCEDQAEAEFLLGLILDGDVLLVE